MDVKTISIDSIGLSNRSRNALHRAGIDTVGDMLVYTEETLFEIRNMGRKSIDEVLLKIEEYRKYDDEGGLDVPDESKVKSLTAIPKDFDAWCASEEGRSFILNWLNNKQVKIRTLESLSARAYNQLLLNNLEDLDQIIFKSYDELMEIPRMDSVSAEEVAKACRIWLKDHKEELFDELKKQIEKASSNQMISLKNLLQSQDAHERVLQYVRANDYDVEATVLSVHSKNLLLRNGYIKLSDFIFLTEAQLNKFKGMGAKSLQEIQSFIEEYLTKHETRLRSFCDGDESVIWDESLLRDSVLKTFNKIGFDGVNVRELREQANIPDQVPDKMLKSVLGRLLAEGILEYVDFRCYRLYPKFVTYLAECPRIDSRNREILIARLQGKTLEAIAGDYNLKRERIRQIVAKNMSKIKGYLRADKNVEWFDEDYYQYFFETYSFDKKDAEEWLGIDKQTYNYLEMSGIDKGEKSLDEAQDDYHNLDLGFRLKIKNYLNRNKLFLDGRWINKTRTDLEEYVVRKYCTDNMSFEEFTNVYNNFLREEEIPYDEKIYYTGAVIRTRKNKLADSRFALWKQNEQIRYYDIDGQDFTELLDALNFDAYENVEYSTWKFMRDYPEIMEKYDIRDQYELHNLLRKIIPDGSYHDFHCERTPIVRFGTFDRDEALLDLLIDNAPISQADFVELIQQEYGYDPITTIGGSRSLQSLSFFYHQGMYRIDQKVMLASDRETLLSELTEDFYYIDEIRKIYAKVVPGADLGEINPYNLKTMGFSILCRYVYRNHSSLEAYFRYLLTKQEITDITPLRNRFAYVVSFSGTLVNMKNKLEILEFEPNHIITFQKLAAAGITREDLYEFCDHVSDFVQDETYFSVQSIKKAGFKSELFDYGFSDWFYANLLTSDDRFSNTKAFGNILLYKGEKRITIQSFEESLINEHGSIDVYDLMTEMEDKYGCRISDRLDLVYKISGTKVCYDKYMDRLYANAEILNRELDESEGV